jgi:hypothetical protein
MRKRQTGSAHAAPGTVTGTITAPPIYLPAYSKLGAKGVGKCGKWANELI